jgi:hypothetical protein
MGGLQYPDDGKCRLEMQAMTRLWQRQAYA